MINHYFISDANNKERRELVGKECKKIGLEPRFFDAIMGNTLTQEELDTYVSKNNMLSLGEIGCALSHLAVYETFLASQEEYVCVFEDDILFDDTFTMDDLQAFCDFVAHKKEATMLALKSTRVYGKKVKNISNYTIHTTARFMYTYAYVLNRKAAENILTLQRPLQFEIDQTRLYYYLNACKLYIVNPSPVRANEACASEIDQIDGNRYEKGYDREGIRKQNYGRLFWGLPLKDKCISLYRRIAKHIKL